MQPEESKPEPSVLDYEIPEPPAPASSADSLVTFSLLCVLVPVVGFMIRNGVLFLIGLPLSFVGIALGVRAIIVDTKAARVSVLGAAATLVNGMSAAFFVWLFFVRGLC